MHDAGSWLIANPERLGDRHFSIALNDADDVIVPLAIDIRVGAFQEGCRAGRLFAFDELGVAPNFDLGDLIGSHGLDRDYGSTGSLKGFSGNMFVATS